MARTPGLIVPSGYSSKEELAKDLQRRNKAAGFTPFDASEFDESVIQHHGIKGMRWGHRKAPDAGVSPGSSGGTPHLPTSEDAARAKEAQKKVKSGGTKVLNTKELQDMVNRMNLERQYSTILAQQPSKFQRGHDAVKKILAVGKTAQEAYQLYNSPMVKDLSKLLKQAAKAKAAAS